MPQPYSNAFSGPNLAQIDRDAYSNSLLKNDVARLPQRNATEDVQMRGQEQAINQDRQANARKFLGDAFSGIAQSQDPINTGRSVLGNSSVQAALRDVGMDPAQFTIDNTDTPESLQRQAMDYARVFGGGTQQSRVQSTQVLEDGTIAYVTSDGNLVRTSERARNPLQIVPGGVGGAPAVFDRQGGQVTALSTPQAEVSAAADREAATTTARTTAQATAETQNVQRANERTLGVWNVAREGLIKALAGTTTGPVSGRMPAVTAGQQIAEGAVAAVAPVLKQLFRSAGEGVFTDRDQQLLIDMIPNRQDHPETATAKMQMIDAIIQAKLSGGQSQGGVPEVGTVQDGYRFLGGDPSQPTSWQQVQ